MAFVVDENYLTIDYDDSYIVDFCIKYHSNANPISIYSSDLPINYFYKRVEILKSIPFTKVKFYKFDILQDSIKDYGLNAEALFELLAFLYDQIDSISKRRIRLHNSKLEELNLFIEKNITELKITLQAGKKKIEVEPSFFEYFHPMFLGYDDVSLNAAFFDHKKFTLRRCSYMMIKNLELSLKPNFKKSNNVAYTNKERDFYLRILHLCEYMLGESNEVCYSGSNSATFNKLMRDFEGEKFTISDFGYL